MSSGAFSRKMYQLRSHVGVSNKTTDADMQNAKNKLNDFKKKFKNIKDIVSKFAPTFHATNLMQVEILTSLKDILDSSSTTGDHVDTVITTFQQLDEGVNAYQERIENDILVPLKTFTEQLKIMEKRMDICHVRRVDMDRYHERVVDISKKQPGKQTGLAEAQAKYQRSRDLYNYLRSELLLDMSNLSRSFEEVVGPIATILITAYTNYINHVNNHWERAIEVCPNFRYDVINTASVITPAEDSMALEQNVDRAKAAEAPVKVDDDDSSSSSSSSSDDDEKKKKKKKQQQQPMMISNPPMRQPQQQMRQQPQQQMRSQQPQQQGRPQPQVPGAKRQPPPPPGKKREQVRCNYDYTAQEYGELTFREGDIITVLKKEGDWWLGELRGQQGLFPYNYASPI